MRSSDGNPETQERLAALVVGELEKVKPYLGQIPIFRSPEAFYNQRLEKCGFEVIMRPDLIASSVLAGIPILELSSLRITPEIKARLADTGSDRVSFSRQLLLAQSGQIFTGYVQFINLYLRDRFTGLGILNATHLEAEEVDAKAFDWTEPVHFGKDSPVVGRDVFLKLKNLLHH